MLLLIMAMWGDCVMKYSLNKIISMINAFDEDDNNEAEKLLMAYIDRSVTDVSLLEMVITKIDTYVFKNCTSLALTSLPENVTEIGAYAFENCTSLSTITFKGTPTTISSVAFRGCTNLTTINVPWSEGEVANAPWGATNATINYDYAE